MPKPPLRSGFVTGVGGVITQKQSLEVNPKFSYTCTLIGTTKGTVMKRIHLDQDIQSLSEFRAGVTSYIRQINETKRPLVITQRGKGVAVVIDVSEYEAMQEKIELLQEIQKAGAQLSAGLGVSNEDARARVLQRLQK